MNDPDALAPAGAGQRFLAAGFRVHLACIVAAGAAWRALLLSRKWDRPLQLNDSFYYSVQATDLAHGHLFREPFRSGPGAEHGPLTSALLALVSWGSDPVPWQRLVTMLAGVATIAVIGLLGRSIGGPRVGLVAAAIAAVYPNLWLSDGLVMSESISVCMVSWSLLVIVRRLDDPSPRAWVAVGAVLGLATLARSEVLVMVPMAAVLAWWLVARPRAGDEHPWWRPMMPAVAVVVAAVAVMAPWIALNLSRFERPVLLTTNDGTTLAGAYCEHTFGGRELGGWSILCLEGPLSDEVLTEPSQRSRVRRDAAVEYLGDHVGDLPKVIAARIGRTLDLYGLPSLIDLDTGEERSLAGVWAGIASFWVLAPAAAVGVAGLRRPVRWTLVLPVIAVMFTTVVFYGAHRIRSTAEPTVVVGAAVAACRWLRPRAGRARGVQAGDASTAVVERAGA